MEKIINRRQQGFFVIDLSTVLSEQYQASIENPFFVLKAGDAGTRTYDYGRVHVSIESGQEGSATIHDKDIWIYSITQLILLYQKEPNIPHDTLQFVAHDYLVSTKRRTDGDNYKRMMASLQRLVDTNIVSYVEIDGKTSKEMNYKLFESWQVVKRPSDNRMAALEITFPQWILDAIRKNQLLVLHPDYFTLRKPLERRIYEIAKKRCKNQIKWANNAADLYSQSGSLSTMREFRRLISVIARANKLPDYQLRYLKNNDTLTFYSRGTRGYKAQIRDMVNQLNKQRNI